MKMTKSCENCVIIFTLFTGVTQAKRQDPLWNLPFCFGIKLAPANIEVIFVERREFLQKGLKSYLRELVTGLNPLEILDDEKRPKEKDYFQSFYSCYPLLSEAPYEQLVEAAHKLGISVENKTKLEIAREVFGERR